MSRLRKLGPFFAGHCTGFFMGSAFAGFMIGAGWIR
jgi:hypothetical protein